MSALARVLAEAFYADPVFAWLMPDEAKRLARLRRFFAVEVRDVALARGSAWTTAELDAAALTMPPDGWRVPLRTVLMQGMLFGVHLQRAARLLAAVERRHIREPHHYFAYVGVSPGRQGEGLGSALMRPTLDVCDAGGIDAYLEASSERNAALYERLGFRVLSELSVAGSPPLRLMRRDGRLGARR